MVLTVCFFFRLIKRLWTRFGNSIRHIWHEKCRCNSNHPSLSCRSVLHTHPHPPAHFLSKRSSSSLFICPPLSMFIDAHNLCNHHSLYSLYSLSVSNSFSFPSVLSCVTPPTAIDQHHPRSTWWTNILSTHPHDIEPLVNRLCFSHENLFSIIFSI